MTTPRTVVMLGGGVGGQRTPQSIRRLIKGLERKGIEATAPFAPRSPA
jgi:hypothetical protein